MAIGGYYINGYCTVDFFGYYMLYYNYGDYCIMNYYWIFYVIISLVIGNYYIVGYLKLFSIGYFLYSKLFLL